MYHRIFILLVVLFPVLAPAQTRTDTVIRSLNMHDTYQAASEYSFMISPGFGFYTIEDTKINSFLAKYGYLPPQEVPVGIQLGIALIPYGSKMVYGVNASTIVSKQSMITADFTLSVYRRIVQNRKCWVTAGLAFGEHFDRIVLNGNLPPSFDSLAKHYGSTLS